MNKRKKHYKYRILAQKDVKFHVHLYVETTPTKMFKQAKCLYIITIQVSNRLTAAHHANNDEQTDFSLYYAL